jgi:hypothetical protein
LGNQKEERRKRKTSLLLYEKFPGEVSGGLGEEISRLIT